jgi:hypothetical protein
VRVNQAAPVVLAVWVGLAARANRVALEGGHQPPPNQSVEVIEDLQRLHNQPEEGAIVLQVIMDHLHVHPHLTGAVVVLAAAAAVSVVAEEVAVAEGDNEPFTEPIHWKHSFPLRISTCHFFFRIESYNFRY